MYMSRSESSLDDASTAFMNDVATTAASVNPLQSGYTRELWHNGVKAVLDYYCADALTTHRAFVESFWPYLTASDAAKQSTEGLQEAIGVFASGSNIVVDGDTWFFEALLPCLVRWAAEFEELFSWVQLLVRATPRSDAEEASWIQSRRLPCVSYTVLALPMLHAHSAGSSQISLTRQQCRAVLSLMFLGIEPRPFCRFMKRPYADGRPSPLPLVSNDPDVSGVGSLSLLRQLADPDSARRQLVPLLHYFEMWRCLADPSLLFNEHVTFARAAPCGGSGLPSPLVGPDYDVLLFNTAFLRETEYGDESAHLVFLRRPLRRTHSALSQLPEVEHCIQRPEICLVPALYSSVHCDGEAAMITAALSMSGDTQCDPTAAATMHPRHVSVLLVEVDMLEEDFNSRLFHEGVLQVYRGLTLSGASTLLVDLPYAPDEALLILLMIYTAAALASKTHLIRLSPPPSSLLASLVALCAHLDITVSTVYRWIAEFSDIRTRRLIGSLFSPPPAISSHIMSFEAGQWPSIKDASDVYEASSVRDRRTAADRGWQAVYIELKKASEDDRAHPFVEFIVSSVAGYTRQALNVT